MALFLHERNWDSLFLGLILLQKRTPPILGRRDHTTLTQIVM